MLSQGRIEALVESVKPNGASTSPAPPPSLRNLSEDEIEKLGKIKDKINALKTKVGFLEDMEVYRRWAPEVGRYSMHWGS